MGDDTLIWLAFHKNEHIFFKSPLYDLRSPPICRIRMTSLKAMIHKTIEIYGSRNIAFVLNTFLTTIIFFLIKRLLRLDINVNLIFMVHYIFNIQFLNKSQHILFYSLLFKIFWSKWIYYNFNTHSKVITFLFWNKSCLGCDFSFYVFWFQYIIHIS